MCVYVYVEGEVVILGHVSWKLAHQWGLRACNPLHIPKKVIKADKERLKQRLMERCPQCYALECVCMTGGGG